MLDYHSTACRLLYVTLSNGLSIVRAGTLTVTLQFTSIAGTGFPRSEDE